MARCESSHFFVCLYKKFPAKRTVGLLVVREGVKGKEEFIMEYYENDWDMYWDINLPEFKARYSEYRYLIFCDNVYSGKNFNKLKIFAMDMKLQ